MWKNYNTEQCFLVMLESGKKSADGGKAFGALHAGSTFGALLTFDYVDHGLLIGKLNAYGFNLPALKLIYDYLSHRK